MSVPKAIQRARSADAGHFFQWGTIMRYPKKRGCAKNGVPWLYHVRRDAEAGRVWLYKDYGNPSYSVSIERHILPWRLTLVAYTYGDTTDGAVSLAQDILADALGDMATARQWMYDVMLEFVAPLPFEREHILYGPDLAAWVRLMGGVE